MRRQSNTIRHDPENGTYGNCHQACFASILDLDLSEVPHFYDQNPALGVADKAQRDWLRSRGLAMGDVLFDGDYSLSDVMATMAVRCPGVPVILGCTSGIGAGHSVVVLDGQVWHDPSGTGVAGPLDGFWWFTFFSVGAAPSLEDKP